MNEESSARRSEERPKSHVRGKVGETEVGLEIESPAAKSTPEPASTFNWDSVVKVVGTAVALGLWIQVVGGAVLWGRFQEAALPGNQIVGLVPNSVLLTVGLRSLMPAFVAGSFAVAVFYSVGAWKEDESLRKANKINEVPVGLRWAVGLLLLGAVITVSWFLNPWSDEFFIALGLAVVAIGLLLAIGAATSGSYTPLAALVFAVTAVWGGAVGYLEERNNTPRFDITALLRKQETIRVKDETKPAAQDRTPLGGFLVGRGDDAILVATTSESFDSTKWRVVVIPPAQVEEMSVGPSCPVTPASLDVADALVRELENDQSDEATFASIESQCDK